MRLHFLGAARQVTGSCYLLEVEGLRLVVDCGLFQERAYLGRNWAPFPIPPETIHFLLLTHAHLDHCGLLPRLVQAGFRGSVVTTAATRDLAEIVLQDSAHIQREDAEFKKKRHGREGRTGPHPVVPLYTEEDVNAATALFRTLPYDRPIPLNDRVRVTFHDAGHILGAAMLELSVGRNGDGRTVLFSGDIGEWDKPIIRDPSVFERADYVVMESTYGARPREAAAPVQEQLADVINATVQRRGNVVIPTFAIERAQELLYHLGQLLRQDRIPHLLVFLDSPMAIDVTEVFRRHRDCMDEEALLMLESGEFPCRFPGLQLVRATGESKAINRIKGSCIILSSAGMCTAGRIKHHLVNNISSARNSILFVGYQAIGTLGRQIVDQAKTVRIHGAKRRVKARVVQIHGFSAHADQTSLLRWLGAMKTPPRQVFLTHGELDAAETLAGLVRSRLGHPVTIPEYRQAVELA